MCIARRTFFRISKRRTHPAGIGSCPRSTGAQNELQGRCRNETQPPGPPIETPCPISGFINRIFSLGYTIETTHARLSAFLVFASSLAFTIASSILVLGIDLNTNQDVPDFSTASTSQTSLHPMPSCVALIYLCIFCYGTTKVNTGDLLPIDAGPNIL
jgi:hypothetical protein